MTTQQLIYNTAVPVNSAQHGKHSVEVGNDYSFTNTLNSLPLMAVEFPHAAGDYAIIFAGTEESVMPAVILGVKEDQNLFVRENGTWNAHYVPAFVRRYPFVFASGSDEKTFTLCIDEEYPGLNTEGKGQPLFDEKGNTSPYVDGVLKFLQDYRSQNLITQAFCKQLIELKLLQPMEAQFSISGGEKLLLNGFMMVDRQKLAELPPETLSEMAKNGYLELIYLHLQSVRNLNEVKDRIVLGKHSEQEAAATESEQEESEANA